MSVVWFLWQCNMLKNKLDPCLYSILTKQLPNNGANAISGHEALHQLFPHLSYMKILQYIINYQLRLFRKRDAGNVILNTWCHACQKCCVMYLTNRYQLIGCHSKLLFSRPDKAKASRVYQTQEFSPICLSFLPSRFGEFILKRGGLESSS